MKSIKYDLLITYIRTPDKGLELRHSLRSLKNITNFSGNITIIGDEENWLKNIRYIPIKRLYGRPYADVVAKLYHAANQMPERFIVSQDDVFICKPTEISYYYKAKLESDNKNYYRRTKLNTIDFLKEHGITDPLDYELHRPYLVERDKLLEVMKMILKHKNRDVLQWRSIYGNLFKPEATKVKDYKTKTKELKDGDIISTQFYTDELNKLFPDACTYERF